MFLHKWKIKSLNEFRGDHDYLCLNIYKSECYYKVNNVFIIFSPSLFIFNVIEHSLLIMKMSNIDSL